MKIIVDKDIPFIEGRIGGETEIISCAGHEIDNSLVKEADALIVRTRTRCDQQLLKGSKVKLVATATIGTDHIDTPWCEQHGIVVTNAPGCNAPGVAQYVFSSLFKAGFNPEKDILGIIGHGHVGGVVAKWAQLMNISTIISDAPKKEEGATDADYLDSEVVLRESDALTIHVPLSYDGSHPTFGLITEKELSGVKPGSILVNSSRGGVVDEHALLREIKTGKIQAITDVWINEPAINADLARLSFISTPHIAGYSAQGKMRATRMVLEALSLHLGIATDISGLECLAPDNVSISPSLILNSYDPISDSTLLKSNLSDFESFRNKYKYRNEPLFYP